MSPDEQANHDPGPPEEEYRLGPPGARAEDFQPEVYPRYDNDEGPPAEEPFQFTLAELFWLVTGAAILLGIVGSIPGGLSVERLAGLAGLGLLVSLVVLAVIQPPRPIVRLAWWTLLGAYVLASLVAVARSLW